MSKGTRYGRLLLLALAAAASLQMTGCASIVKGTHQTVGIQARKNDTGITGAHCVLSNDKGQWEVDTPGMVEVHRAYGDLHVVCSKDQDKGSIAAHSSTQAAVFGNILAGGIIGVAVDSANGSAYDYPNALVVTMGVFSDIPVDKAQMVATSSAPAKPVAATAPAATVAPAVPVAANAPAPQAAATANMVASNAPLVPQAPINTELPVIISAINRSTSNGQTVRLGTHAMWDNHCRARPVPEVTVRGAPMHGKVELHYEQYVIGEGDACVGRAVEGVAVYFVPDANYHGADELMYTVALRNRVKQINADITMQ